MLESSLEGSLESSLESSSGSARRETNHSLHRTQELSVRTAARRWSPAAGACVCIAPLAQRQRPPPPPRPASRSPRTYSRCCREVLRMADRRALIELLCGAAALHLSTLVGSRLRRRRRVPARSGRMAAPACLAL